MINVFNPPRGFLGASPFRIMALPWRAHLIRTNLPANTSRFCALMISTVMIALIGAPVVVFAYEDGELIEIAGTVSDGQGVPIPDIGVRFRAARRAFTVSKFGRATKDTVQMDTKTDPHGQFSFEWRWLDYYNRFEVQTGVPSRSAAGESFEVLGFLDLDDRIEKGSPVVASLTVEDSRYLNTLRDFLESVDSDDEKRIYNEMGNPDRVQKIEHSDFDEISWWYFRSGKAYRFREGELDQVVHFEPVTPFAP